MATHTGKDLNNIIIGGAMPWIWPKAFLASPISFSAGEGEINVPTVPRFSIWNSTSLRNTQNGWKHTIDLNWIAITQRYRSSNNHAGIKKIKLKYYYSIYIDSEDYHETQFLTLRINPGSPFTHSHTQLVIWHANTWFWWPLESTGTEGKTYCYSNLQRTLHLKNNVHN